MKPKVFSGIRPSGKLHLGNYLGAIKNWIELQNEAEQAVFAVVDLHGITTPYDPKTFQEGVTDAVLDFLAAGVDPKKSLLIRQSKVPQHAELMWLFSTITPLGWLERLPNYREKLEQVKNSDLKIVVKEDVKVTDSIKVEGGTLKIKEKIKYKEGLSSSYQNNLGLLAYPVLMAADILLYKSDLVPVGEDQLLHLNLANELGAKFNHLFGPTFPNVKAHTVTGARVMSLQDPLKKMSKTGDDGIALSDGPDVIISKIKRAVTDSGREIKYDPEKKPAVSNLIDIYHLLSGEQIGEIEVMYQDKTYSEFKNDLAEVVVEFLKPFQQRHTELKNNIGGVIDILEESEEKARAIAQKNLDEIKQAMGLQ